MLVLTLNGWLGLTSLEVYNNIFEITQENIFFELHTDIVDEFSFAQLKDETEEIFDDSNISPENIQDKTLGPRIN